MDAADREIVLDRFTTIPVGKAGPVTDYDDLRDYLSEYVRGSGFEWTHTNTGQLDLTDGETFKMSARCIDGDYSFEIDAIGGAVFHAEADCGLDEAPNTVAALRGALATFRTVLCGHDAELDLLDGQISDLLLQSHTERDRGEPDEVVLATLARVDDLEARAAERMRVQYGRGTGEGRR